MRKLRLLRSHSCWGELALNTSLVSYQCFSFFQENICIVLQQKIPDLENEWDDDTNVTVLSLQQVTRNGNWDLQPFKHSASSQQSSLAIIVWSLSLNWSWTHHWQNSGMLPVSESLLFQELNKS
jgi:hypothetical protein